MPECGGDLREEWSGSLLLLSGLGWSAFSSSLAGSCSSWSPLSVCECVRSFDLFLFPLYMSESSSSDVEWESVDDDEDDPSLSFALSSRLV